jgi:uncharacterized protein (TIRG00374 family)
MKKRWIPYVKLMCGVGLLAFLISRVSWGSLLAGMRDVRPLYVILSFCLSIIMVSMSCLKWMVIVHYEGYRVRFSELLKIYFVGYFFTNVLPSNVGGDVARSCMLGKRIDSQGRAAVSVFLERVSGVVVLLLLVVFAPLLQWRLYWSLRIQVAVAGAIFLLACLAASAFLKVFRSVGTSGEESSCGTREGEGVSARANGVRKLFFLVVRLRRIVFAKMRSFHERLLASMGGMSTKAMLLILMLSCGFYFLTFVNVMVAFAAFGVHLDGAACFAVLPAAMFIGMIPLLPGGFGFAEGVYVYYFSLVGVPAPAALLMGLLLRVKVLVLGLIGSGCFILNREKDNNDER